MSLAFDEPIEKFFVQTSTPTPRMHQLTEHGKFHMEKNQLLTKTPVELKG